LRLAGIRNPHAFKKLIWAMKRLQAFNLTIPKGDAGGSIEDIAVLLPEIRDEIRSQNKQSSASDGESERLVEATVPNIV
jgi:hypothetical protein